MNLLFAMVSGVLLGALIATWTSWREALVIIRFQSELIDVLLDDVVQREKGGAES